MSNFDLNEIDLGNTQSNETDYIGFSYKIFESGLYKATINKCYGITPKEGKTKGVTLEFEVESTNEQGNKENSIFNYTIWLTNKNGEAFYINKKSGNKERLPGYNLFETITFAAVGKEIKELNKPTNEIIDLYNFEQKKEVPTEVPMFKELIGKSVALGLIKEERNKTIKDKATGEYVAIADKVIANEIDKVFTIKGGKVFTMTEMKSGLEEPTFFTTWLNRNKGNTRNKYQEIEGVEEQPKAGKTTESIF